MGYRNARDELKHRIVIDGLLNSMLPGESVVITDYSIFDPDRCLTEGAYWYAIEYKKIKYCTFMLSDKNPLSPKKICAAKNVFQKGLLVTGVFNLST